MNVVRQVKYASSYSFKYSPRPGTPASLMKNQVPEDVKTERLIRLQELLLQQQKEAYESVIGKTLPVLLTEKGKRKGQLIGYTPYLQSTHVTLDESYLNKIVSLKITKASATSLSSEFVCDIIS